MKRNNECILLYNITPDKRLQAIKNMLRIKKFPFRIITDEETQHTIGYLISAPGYTPCSSAVPTPLMNEVMIMKGCTSRRLDELLNAFHEQGIPPVSLKAVVTDTNMNWSFQQLYVQLNLEHSQMMAYRNRQS